jgi:hypothetical protein
MADSQEIVINFTGTITRHELLPSELSGLYYECDGVYWVLAVEAQS